MLRPLYCPSGMNTTENSAKPRPTLTGISALQTPRQRRGRTAKRCTAILSAPQPGQQQAASSEIIATIQGALADALIAAWERDRQTTEPQEAAAA